MKNPHSQEAIKKMSEKAIQRWKDSNYRKKLLVAQKAMGLRNYPTVYANNH